MKSGNRTKEAEERGHYLEPCPLQYISFRGFKRLAKIDKHSRAAAWSGLLATWPSMRTAKGPMVAGSPLCDQGKGAGYQAMVGGEARLRA